MAVAVDPASAEAEVAAVEVVEDLGVAEDLAVAEDLGVAAADVTRTDVFFQVKGAPNKRERLGSPSQIRIHIVYQPIERKKRIETIYKIHFGYSS